MTEIRMKGASKEDQDEWREGLERLGLEVARERMNRSATPVDKDDFVNFVQSKGKNGKPPRHATRGFIENWITEQQKLAKVRADRQNILLWVAAIASVVGAFAAVFGTVRSW